ncbi:MAG: HD domain-containing protein, partial [Caldilineaceae bacterium]
MAVKNRISTPKLHKITLSNAQKLAAGWLAQKPPPSGQSEAASLSFRNQSERMTLDEIMSHSQTVAELLREWGASAELQAAGLLHSFLWNCVIEDREVIDACGEHVLFLCRQYQHILQRMPEARWRGKRVVLERIKYFVAAYCHFDLAFLAAADLWDRFRLALQSEPSQQRQYIQEGSQVLSPYLDFLGMRELK